MAGEGRLKKIRNIGIISHIDAGKTTVSERILYYTGVSYKIGEVHDGEAVMDWMPQEQERGITITSAVTTCGWRGHEIHVIDTPGHVDFTVEVERSLRVLDGAIAIFSAVEGVEPQSETVWHQADKYRVPRVAFINKMDRLGADFSAVIDMMVEKLGVRPLVVTLPVGSEEEFSGVIDLIDMCVLTFSGEDLGTTVARGDIPEGLKDKSAEYRDKLLEAVSDIDDDIAERYLEGEEIAKDSIIDALRRGTIKGSFVPIFCGSGLRNKGIQPLLDGVVDFLPSPIDVPPISGTNPKTGGAEVRRSDENEPLSALAFKVQVDQGRKLTYFRVYSGVLKAGAEVYNPRLKKPERIARLLKMHANKRERIDTVKAGDIAAAVGLKDTTTGDTLCDRGKPILLESILFTDPVISLAIEPKTVADQERLDQSLGKLVDEDPTLMVKVDEDTGQTIISGMGELHLEIVVDRLLREFNVAANVGKPQVVYRETATKGAESEAVIDREIAGEQRYARVSLSIEPIDRGLGVEVKSLVTSDGIPEEWMNSAVTAVRDAAASGPILGYPLDDVKISILALDAREGLTDEMAFSIASGMAVRSAAEKASPVLLEPIMAVEILTPEEFMGEIIGDLNARGGHLKGVDPKGKINHVRVEVPLSNMFGYSTKLRSQSQGRATFTMQFSHYGRLDD